METPTADEALKVAEATLENLNGTLLNVLTVEKPKTTAEIQNIAKIISKLSALVGNLIEFKTADILNANKWFTPWGHWDRQDPGFPDIIFNGQVKPSPGVEIKAWFPLSTEITGRFKDSEERFVNNEIDLAILAWIPEFLFWGKPKIIGVCISSGSSVAKARDTHYHNPPRYLVFEPEDTSNRTSNLQQSNTNGYVIQDSRQKSKAQAIVDSWGPNATQYSTKATYQRKLKDLMGRVDYRLDTNYAKIDRIRHAGIELFKTKMLNTEIYGRSIKSWIDIIQDLPEDVAADILQS